MSWLDLLILGVIALSALISLIRGFVKESISLLSWIAAGIVAFRYFSAMAELLEPYLADPTIRSMAAFAILFISTGLSGTDKALGVVFGGARGVLIVTMIVLLASLTPMPEAQWWQDSAMVGFFQELAEWVKGIIPADAVDSFSF
jgi:membrane protein required for colicin V production